MVTYEEKMKEGHLEKCWNCVCLEEEGREDLKIRECSNNCTEREWNEQYGTDRQGRMEEKNKIKTLSTEICRIIDTLYPHTLYTTLLEKYPTLFYLRKPGGFQWRLHEATLNLHTNTWIFSRLSIGSVDGKQRLNDIVFSALVKFSL